MSMTLSHSTARVLVGLSTAGLLAVGAGAASAHGPSKAGKHGAAPANGQVVRSETVVRTGTGVTTRLTQYGTVTAISPTSLTVASADAVSQTWVLNSGTRYRASRDTQASNATVAVGDTVAVAGVRSGASDTAQLVEEKTPKATPTASPTTSSPAATSTVRTSARR
ncbi:MAG: hypothetical protein JWM64_1214 [Frankiales bacterium]|nr:hypothetical protein [Frankiales bacterium]